MISSSGAVVSSESVNAWVMSVSNDIVVGEEAVSAKISGDSKIRPGIKNDDGSVRVAANARKGKAPKRKAPTSKTFSLGELLIRYLSVYKVSRAVANLYIHVPYPYAIVTPLKFNS